MPNPPKKKSASRKRRIAKSAPLHPIHFSTRLSVADVTGVSTRTYVYQCIQAAAPGAEFGDESSLDSIPVSGDNVGLCLNLRIPLTGDDAWRAGEIQGAWSVGILISKTDSRRKH